MSAGLEPDLVFREAKTLGISPRVVLRLCERRLLQRVKGRGRGYGLGRETWPFEGTTIDRLQVVTKIGTHNYDLLAFELWREGYDIPERTVRDALLNLTVNRVLKIVFRESVQLVVGRTSTMILRKPSVRGMIRTIRTLLSGEGRGFYEPRDYERRANRDVDVNDAKLAADVFAKSLNDFQVQVGDDLTPLTNVLRFLYQLDRDKAISMKYWRKCLNKCPFDYLEVTSEKFPRELIREAWNELSPLLQGGVIRQKPERILALEEFFEPFLFTFILVMVNTEMIDKAYVPKEARLCHN